jgi:uncharacterized membrane protein YgcG
MEQIPLGQSIVMLLFLAIAALIVISLVCKLLVAFGLVRDRSTSFRRVVYALASVVGTVRTTRGSRNQSAKGTRGGGGSFGGGGASGGW